MERYYIKDVGCFEIEDRNALGDTAAKYRFLIICNSQPIGHAEEIYQARQVIVQYVFVALREQRDDIDRKASKVRRLIRRLGLERKRRTGPANVAALAAFRE